MGPEATVLLMSRIIAATSASDDCDHVPMIVDNNTQVPSRIAALVDGTGADPGPVLAEMARKLEAYGAEALVMPCNTAHNFADTIRAAVAVPFIDMIAETVSALSQRSPACRRIGVLASPATRVSGVFDRSLGAAGYQLVLPNDETTVLRTIQHIKSRGPDAVALALLQADADRLEAANVDVILIGCTEFSLLKTQVHASVPLIDTLDILVARALTFALPQTAATA